MATKMKTGPSKGQSKRPVKHNKGTTSSTSKKPSASKPAAKPTQQKTKPTTSSLKKKTPPHLRYTEKDLNLPQLNGIRPAGVQKAPRAKKGKNFVDDKEQMNAILAMVMAEKEGNIESKMMRARQLEEVREARRVEAEKRAEGKKAGLEERKEGIREERRMRKKRRERGSSEGGGKQKVESGSKTRKRVSFG